MDKKKVLTITAVIAGISLIGYGLYKLFKKQVELAMSYCYKIKDYKINSLSISNIDLDVFVLFKNQSNFNVSLTSYDLGIYINDRLIGKVGNPAPQSISGKSISTIKANIKVNPANIWGTTHKDELLMVIYYATMDKSRFVLEVKGTISAKLDFISVKNLPLDIKMTLAQITAASASNDEAVKCVIQ